MTIKRYKQDPNAIPIIDKYGNEWYGYTQEEVDFEIQSQEENLVEIQFKNKVIQAYAINNLFKDILNNVENNSNNTDEIIYNIYNYTGEYSKYVARIYYECIFNNIKPWTYWINNPPDFDNWYLNNF
jgi:hypothetical protein